MGERNRRIIVAGNGPTLSGRTVAQPIVWALARSLSLAGEDVVGVISPDPPDAGRDLARLHLAPPLAFGSLEVNGRPLQDPFARPPSATTLRACEGYLRVFDHLLDRISSGPLRASVRRTLWLEGLAWAERLLDQHQPSHIVWAVMPHFPFDFVLMAVAASRGTPVWAFEQTFRQDRVWLVDCISRVFGTGDSALQAVLAPASRPVDQDEVSRELRRHEQAYLPPAEERRLRGQQVGKARVLTSLLIHVGRLAATAARSIGAPREVGTRPDLVGRRLALRLRAGGLLAPLARARYDRRAIKTPPRERFVLLALHDEPERVVVPLCYPMLSQDSVIDMVASTAARHGLAVVIKEHPSRFNAVRTKPRRPDRWYKAVTARYSNACWASTSTNPMELAAESTLVITGTGTIGWESLQRGYPVVVFGRAWYRDPRGVRSVDVNDLDEILMAGPQSPSRSEVVDLLREICARTIVARNEGEQFWTKEPTDPCVRTHAEALAALVTETLTAPSLHDRGDESAVAHEREL